MPPWRIGACTASRSRWWLLGHPNGEARDLHREGRAAGSALRKGRRRATRNYKMKTFRAYLGNAWRLVTLFALRRCKTVLFSDQTLILVFGTGQLMRPLIRPVGDSCCS